MHATIRTVLSACFNAIPNLTIETLVCTEMAHVHEVLSRLFTPMDEKVMSVGLAEKLIDYHVASGASAIVSVAPLAESAAAVMTNMLMW